MTEKKNIPPSSKVAIQAAKDFLAWANTTYSCIPQTEEGLKVYAQLVQSTLAMLFDQHYGDGLSAGIMQCQTPEKAEELLRKFQDALQTAVDKQKKIPENIGLTETKDKDTLN